MTLEKIKQVLTSYKAHFERGDTYWLRGRALSKFILYMDSNKNLKGINE